MSCCFPWYFNSPLSVTNQNGVQIVQFNKLPIISSCIKIKSTNLHIFLNHFFFHQIRRSFEWPQKCYHTFDWRQISYYGKICNIWLQCQSKIGSAHFSKSCFCKSLFGSQLQLHTFQLSHDIENWVPLLMFSKNPQNLMINSFNFYKDLF